MSSVLYGYYAFASFCLIVATLLKAQHVALVCALAIQLRSKDLLSGWKS